MTAVADRNLSESYWAADDSLPLSDHTVGSLLAELAENHSGTTALVGTPHGGSERCRLTYAELYDAARRVAIALTELTQPGEFVALWAPNVIEWPIIEYGAALAGRVLVALNPAFREGELVYTLEHSGAAVLIHADEHRGYDMARSRSRRWTRVLAWGGGSACRKPGFGKRALRTAICRKSIRTVRRCCSTPRAPLATRKVFCCGIGRW